MCDYLGILGKEVLFLLTLCVKDMDMEKKNSRAIDRLREFVLYLKLQKRITGDFQFETMCGLSNKYLSNSSKDGRPGSISSDVIARIHTVFPELDITWLCTGEGRMIVGGGNCKTGSVEELIFRLESLLYEFKKR